MKMNKFLIAFFILIFGSCECSNEPLEDVLGQPCLLDTDSEEGYFVLSRYETDLINVGICKAGKVERAENGIKICTGQIDPQQEECNNLDDNCDGEIDNSWYVDKQYWDESNTCVGPGVCRYSSQICINGSYVCNHPVNYGEEKCDGLDNDCDGERDEDTAEDPLFEPEDRFVYTADPETINVGECRAGYKECINGRVSIRNMRTPVPEICGNGDDDDCDGYTDERENNLENNDILFIIDYSGSMSIVINSVADALCGWSSQGVLTNSRFAVVAIGFVDHTTTWKETKVLTDFTDSGTACSIIRYNNRPNSQGSVEYQLDAIYQSNDSDTTQISLSWMSENRKVFIFSDEEMQSSFIPILDDALDAITQQCIEAQYTLGAFISYNDPNQAEWVYLTQACGGFLDYLSNNSEEMIDAMNYWLGTDC